MLHRPYLCVPPPRPFILAMALKKIQYANYTLTDQLKIRNLKVFLLSVTLNFIDKDHIDMVI